jgi:biopolymer transport protein TolQ
MVVLELVQNRRQGEARSVSVQIGRGINSLVAIRASAPFVGAFGTALGILGSFRGITAEKTSIMAALAFFLAEAITPAAGLLIALVAHACQLNTFRLELAVITPSTGEPPPLKLD